MSLQGPPPRTVLAPNSTGCTIVPLPADDTDVSAQVPVSDQELSAVRKQRRKAMLGLKKTLRSWHLVHAEFKTSGLDSTGNEATAMDKLSP